MSRLAAVLDTSVLIARESGRPLLTKKVPNAVAITVITLAELGAGIHAAQTVEARIARMATLKSVESIAVLDIDPAAAERWANFRAHLFEAKRRIGVNDLWIASVAAARGLPVVTQDDDFDVLEGVAGFEVIKV